MRQVDLSTGELWRGGFRINLQSHPFRVLAELVQHAGKVLTRKELQERVWEKGTNTDFDDLWAQMLIRSARRWRTTPTIPALWRR